MVVLRRRMMESASRDRCELIPAADSREQARHAEAANTQPANAAKRAPGSVRIIAGEWRGRRLDVVAGADIRPTPDRVRETLFNWLAPVLPGMHCLDLYAGTGVLGLEALSRGAAESWFVEQDVEAARAIEAVLVRFGGQEHHKGRVLRADARRWLAGPVPRSFDLVFLDPPYAGDAAGRFVYTPRAWLACPACVGLSGDEPQERAAGTARRLAIAPGARGWRGALCPGPTRLAGQPVANQPV